MDTRTIVRPAASGTRATPRSSLSIPSELLAEARARTRRLALLSGPPLLLLGAGWAGARAAGWADSWIAPGAMLALGALSLALLVVARATRVSDRAVARLGLGQVVFACGALGLVHAAHEFDVYGHVTAFGPHAAGIAMFPLLIPCPPALTLAVAFAAAAAAIGGLAAADLLGAVTATAGAYLDFASVPLVCAVAAYGISRSLFRLQTDVARARRMGSYLLERKLGAGGMGEVWTARHQLLARPAAIKLLRSDLAGAHADLIERFRREARATAALESPHTVRLYDFGVTDDGSFFYVMELLDGVDLETLVELDGPQPPERVRAILIQICDSLAEAHDAGLIHRDVKPANIMLCRQGRRLDVVKVLDFGLVAPHAWAALPADRLTLAGSIVGTPAFLSPEAATGQALDPRSDLYSLGCVAYWLLTGARVFDAATPAEMLAAHLRDTPRPPSARGPALPAALEALVLDCLAKDPAARPQSADAVAAALAAVPDAAPWDHGRAAGWWARTAARRADRAAPGGGDAGDAAAPISTTVPIVKRA